MRVPDECPRHFGLRTSSAGGGHYYRCGCLLNTGPGGIPGWYYDLFDDERGRDDRADRIAAAKASGRY